MHAPLSTDVPILLLNQPIAICCQTPVNRLCTVYASVVTFNKNWTIYFLACISEGASRYNVK